MIDLMIDAIKGDIEDDEEADNLEQFEMDAVLKHNNSKKNLDELSIVSTALAILVAGLDTIRSTLIYAFYQLSVNPECQEKLWLEINDTLAANGNENLSYDDLQRMTYLDQIVCETLRLHNVSGLAQRVTTKEYKIPGTDVVLPKDTLVRINILGIHTNPKHYETPLVFDTDHFSKEAKEKRNP